MKKRKILLGFLLAGAAFSFAACTNNKDANKNDDKSSDTSGDSGDQGGQGGQTEKVTVTFNANNGSANTTAQVDKGGKVTKPSNPEKAADAQNTYAFEGWYKDSALTQAFNFDTETVSAALTLYAKYTATPIAPARTFAALFIDSSSVKTTLEDGEKINLAGLVVQGLDATTFDTVTLAANEYTVTIKDASENVVDINTALTEGTYTATISSGDTVADDKITFTVTASQYKFTLPLICDDYNASLETPVTASYTFANSETVYESKACKVTMGTGVIIQVTDSNGNAVTKEYDGKAYNSRFQVNTGDKKMEFVAKADGTLTFLFQTSAGRHLQISDNASASFDSADVTADTKDSINVHTISVKKGNTYKINSSTGGTNIYAVYFNVSVDASTVVNTDDLYLEGAATEFNNTNNKFNCAAPNGLKVVAENNLGQKRDVALSECTIVVKDHNEKEVTGEITSAGTYTVSVTYDGKTSSYEISVIDLSTPISAIEIDTTEAKTKYYQGEDFSTEGIVVTATRGDATQTLKSNEYTVALSYGSSPVTKFETAGNYTVTITSTENPEVSSTYTVVYNTLISIEFKNVADEMTIATGTTKFVHNASVVGTYSDQTIVYLSNEVTYKLYSDQGLTTEVTDTAAFAQDGTVYAVLSCKGTTKTITITVSFVQTFTWTSTQIAVENKNDKDALAAGPLDSFFTLNGSAATVRINSDKTKVTSIELGKSFKSYISFTVDGPAKVTLQVASTGGSSITSGFGVYANNDGTGIVSGNPGQATGTGATTLTYDISDAGTYYVGYTETERAGRIISITVEYLVS